MRKKHSSLIAVLVLMGAFGGLLTQTSARFPPVYQDEVVFSVHGYNFLSGQGHRYSLYDDIFDRSVYVIRDALPDITRILYNGWVGLWLKGVGRGYRPARWSSVVAGMLVLWLLYLIGVTLEGLGLGLAACFLCAASPVMLFASSIVRPEILLTASVALSLWLMLRVPGSWPWKPFAIGTLMGLSTAIHWNAIATGSGLLAASFLLDHSAKRVQHVLWMIGGLVAGALIAFRCVDPQKFLLSLRTVNYMVSTPPPILGDPWHPWRWILLMLHTVVLGQTSFMNWTLVPGWRAAIALSWAAIGLSILASPSRPWTRALLTGFVVTLTAMLCLIKRQEFTYALTLFPFLLPLAGGLWTQPQPSSIRTGYRVAVSLCLGASLLFYGTFAYRFIQRIKSFDRVTAELHKLLPDSSFRVAGPNVIWFTWPVDSFRDIGAVITSGWYTEGRKDLAGCLLPWKPDVLVIDPAFRHIVGGSQPMLPLLRRVLPADVQYTGIISGATGPDQDWEFYRLSWHVPTPAGHQSQP